MSIISTTVHIFFKNQEIIINTANEHCNSFGQLKDILTRRKINGLPINYCFGNKDQIKLNYDDTENVADAIEANGTKLLLTLVPRMKLIIRKTMNQEKEINVPSQDNELTIGQLKTLYDRETKNNTTRLAIARRGPEDMMDHSEETQLIELEDDRTLSELKLVSEDILYASIEIIIMDFMCQTEHRLLAYYPETFASIQRKYFKISNRAEREGGLSLNDRQLEANATVGEKKLIDGSRLNFSGDNFEVEIEIPMSLQGQEKRESMRLIVADHETVAQVKQHIFEQLDEVAEPTDQLVYKDLILDDPHKINVYRIESKSRLKLQREDVALGLEYICADCGYEQKIQKDKPIICRSCGFRIVYKKRTKQIAEYLAR